VWVLFRVRTTETMAKGKRDRRATIRSMTAEPELLDASVWEQAEPSPDADAGTAAETPPPSGSESD
jgi:hypothetical protein